MNETRDHVIRNRTYWDETNAAQYEEPGRAAWARKDPWWGVWRVPESSLKVLPDVSGLDAVELGCGTAYVSAWLARRGARPVGINNSKVQLANARRFQREFGLEFHLLHADAEVLPFRSGSFDLAVSEYGAALWCEPKRWIAEAARVLKPGGQLIFMSNSPLLMLTVPDTEAEGPAGDRLIRDYFGMYRFEWPDSEGVEFHLSHGDWIRLLRSHGLDLEDLIEVQAPEGSTTRHNYITYEWARRWPGEDIWKARKRW
jgi:SAM-dependent methyltransferase